MAFGNAGPFGPFVGRTVFSWTKAPVTGVSAIALMADMFDPNNAMLTVIILSVGAGALLGGVLAFIAFRREKRETVE